MSRVLLTAFFFVSVLSLNPKLFAQDYRSAFNLYVSGDFSAAELSLSQYLNQDLSDLDRARAFKALGLSQYMQGKRQEAAQSFKDAKRYQRNIALEAPDILDPSVKDFFASIAAPPAEEHRKKKKTLPVPQAKEEPQKKQELTQFLVLANVTDAKVSIDGYYRGKVGDVILLEPGSHSVEVYASSFKNQVQSVTMIPGQLNKVTVQLEPMVVAAPPPPPPVLAPKELKKEPKKEEKLAVKKKKSPPSPVRSQEEVSHAYYVLPFAVGQYMQDKIWLGLASTAGQSLGLGLYALQQIQANRLVDQTDSYISDRTQQESQISNPITKQEFADETDQYYSDKHQEINKFRTQSYYGLSIFIALWVASSLEAFLNPPSSSKTNLGAEGSSLPGQRELRRSQLEWSFVPRYRPSQTKYSSGSFALSLDLRF